MLKKTLILFAYLSSAFIGTEAAENSFKTYKYDAQHTCYKASNYCIASYKDSSYWSDLKKEFYQPVFLNPGVNLNKINSRVYQSFVVMNSDEEKKSVAFLVNFDCFQDKLTILETYTQSDYFGWGKTLRIEKPNDTIHMNAKDKLSILGRFKDQVCTKAKELKY